VQAIEDEGGDPDSIELTMSADTPTRKHGKSKGKLNLHYLNLTSLTNLNKLIKFLYCTSSGKKTDLDADTTMEEESLSKV